MRRLNPVGGRVVVAVLVVVNVLLLGLAFHYRHGPASPPAAAAVTVSPRPIPTPSRAQSGQRSATSSPAPLLSQASPAYAIAATAGCTTPARLTVTVNDEYNTIPLTSPAKYILGLAASSPKRAWLVGADARCSPRYYTTTNGGQTWQARSSLGQVWVALKNGVRSPSGSVTSPCRPGPAGPIAVSGAGSKDAMVICRLGVFRTTSGGKQWAAVTSLPAGRPVNLQLDRNGHGVMLLTGLGDCPGLRVAQTSNLGVTWSAGDCLNNVQAPAAVSVDRHGDGLIVGSGQTYRTSDGGSDWT